MPASGVRRSWLTKATSRRRETSAACSDSRIWSSHTIFRAWWRASMTAAGMVTTETITSTTPKLSKLSLTMKPLA